MGPVREFFANIKMRSALIDQTVQDTDYGRLRAGIMVRQFESTHPDDLAFASDLPASFFQHGIYVAGLAHVGCEHAMELVNTTMGALGDGTILKNIQDLFTKLVAWISDPANQAKLMAAIKFIMTIFALFAGA